MDITNTYRYLTLIELELIINDKKKNHNNVWRTIIIPKKAKKKEDDGEDMPPYDTPRKRPVKLSKEEQEIIINGQDKSILKKLLNIINNQQTIRLLENYYELKNDDKIIDYIIDLERALSEFNDRERYIITSYYMDGKNQEEIAFDLLVSPKPISQQRISKILNDSLDKLTKILMEKCDD